MTNILVAFSAGPIVFLFWILMLVLFMVTYRYIQERMMNSDNNQPTLEQLEEELALEGAAPKRMIVIDGEEVELISGGPLEEPKDESQA